MDWTKNLFVFAFFPALVQVSCNNYDYSNYESALPEKVDFNYHIKPILSDKCFACHGPDQNAQKANLRLDTEQGLLKEQLKTGGHAFVPGSINNSIAFKRINSIDPETQMPPPGSKLPLLTPQEKALFAKWIEQGAEFKKHWAFIPVERPLVPEINRDSENFNQIDHFVINSLSKKGWDLSPEAEKEVLIRRATLDLTGLPPTLEDIDDFINDNDADAWEKVVDRLLASPHYGERMTLEWLDVARYADSHGYSQDGYRVMWPWRDWVIKSFNENMPWDQFVTWQLAGDKLTNASDEQRLATAFLRNQKLNSEGGIIQEEYMVEYAADRTETFGTAFLGMTLQCARCHEHKNDPVSQEEYYRLFSFFNNVNETGLVQKDGNSGPQIRLKTKHTRDMLAIIDQKINSIEDDVSILFNTSSKYSNYIKVDLKNGLMVHLDFNDKKESAFLNLAKKDEYFKCGDEVQQIDGKNGQAVRFSGYDNVFINREDLDFDGTVPFSFSFWLNSNHENYYMPVLFNLGGKNMSYPGYEVAILDDYLTLRIVHTLPANLIAVRAGKKSEKGLWTHYSVTYDGSGKASGVSFFVNGKKTTQHVLFDQLEGSAPANGKRLKVGGKQDYQTTIKGHGLVDDLMIYNRQLSALEVMSIFDPDLSADRPSQTDQIVEHNVLNNEKYLGLVEKLVGLRKKKNAILDTLPTIMVMQDLPDARETFLLDRGVYDAIGKQVFPGTPKIILPFPKDLSNDRLGLAQWLADKKNPLTARVAVNRFWQMFFGMGLVKTTEDFGSQGALPTHPELLDWLAADFMESGWDVKRAIKQIVMSATYRQSSRSTNDLHKKDPDNEFLARGPSHRLQAEIIRDLALEASGLLVKTIGGESVKPYQPKGLWSEKNQFSEVLKFYVQDHGEKLYRRGLYTFWRRTSPPPPMAMLDAPTRDNCTVRRQKTNTPLQALVLLNAPQFTETSRKLAERTSLETINETERIVMAYRLLTSLTPDHETTQDLTSLYREQKDHFKQNPDLATKLLSVGESPPDPTLEPGALAALTVVCNTILNFDETIVKR